MIPALAMAAALLAFQEPKTPTRTVEERLKELEDKVTVLEGKHKVLADENATLEKRLADARAARETYARQAGSTWTKQYASAVEFTPKQSAEIEELWYAWTKEDFEKPADAARWKSREDALRAKLTAEQLPRLARKVKDDQEQTARRFMGSILQGLQFDPEHVASCEKIVAARMKFDEDVLLTPAHPGSGNVWDPIRGALEASLPELATVLTEDEKTRLRELLERWKAPKR